MELNLNKSCFRPTQDPPFTPGQTDEGRVMLSKIIVSFYGVLLEVSMWVIMVAALIGGWMADGFIAALGCNHQHTHEGVRQ